jgi:tetratricopeptide (TPR) repeat protein
VPDPQRDRFHYWLERIEGADVRAEVVEPVSMDWFNAMQRVLQLDQRHTSILPHTMFGRANEDVIAELQAILEGYRQVLEAGIPDQWPISTEDVQRRCAQALDSLGRSSDALERYEEARAYYEAAYTVYKALSDEQQAAAARERLARVHLDAEGDVDAELLRLQAAIEAAPAPSMPRVRLMVELAELYERGGDDFSAAPLLERAQSGLGSLGYNDPAGPTGGDLARALAGFVQAASSENVESRAARLQEVILVRDLYLRIYFAWVQIHQGRGETAAAEKYRALAAELESEEINREFSQQMLSALPELFAGDGSGEIDKNFSGRVRSLLKDMDWFS